MRALRLTLPLSFAMLVALPAGAGQLHREHFSLLDVHTSGGAAVVGTVVSVSNAGPRDPVVELTVKRVLTAADADSTEWRAWRAGSVQRIHLFPGVEWTDPRRSPIERRLFGFIESAAAGDDVIVVSETQHGLAHMLPATPSTLRALAVVFDDGGARSRYAQEPRATLEADVADDHLVRLALDALAPLGGPSAAALLRARYDVRFAVYRALGTPARRRLFVEGAQLARSDAGARRSLLQLALDGDVDVGALAELAHVAALLDPMQRDELAQMETLRGRLARLTSEPREGALDLSPLAPFIGAFYVHRPRHHASDQELARFMAQMAPPARIALATTLLGAVHTSAQAGDGVDTFLLREATRVLVAEPALPASSAPGLLPVLASVDPGRATSTRGQTDVLASVAHIGAALTAASPSSAAEVKRIVDAAQARAPRATLPSAHALARARVKLVEETVTLAEHGAQHRFANGAVLTLRRDPPILSMDCDDVAGGGGGTLSYASETGYREWWTCRYLLHVDDDAPAARSLRIRAVPQPVPPAPMSTEHAFALVDKALAEAECSRERSVSQDRDRGWLLFEAKTATGKRCRALIGMYSRTIVRLEVPR